MKAIIFNSKIEAKNWDWEHNDLTASISKYRYATKKLKATTTYTKAEYAELMGIPATIDGEDSQTPNPQYEELENSYTLNNYALMVGDAFAEYDEEDNKSYVNGEVDITSDLIYVSEE